MRPPPNDLPLNRDEWPNLDAVDARPRFPDGEPVTPLTPEQPRVHPLRIVAAVVLLVGALIVRACEPGYTKSESAATVRD